MLLMLHLNYPRSLQLMCPPQLHQKACWKPLQQLRWLQLKCLLPLLSKGSRAQQQQQQQPSRAREASEDPGAWRLLHCTQIACRSTPMKKQRRLPCKVTKCCRQAPMPLPDVQTQIQAPAKQHRCTLHLHASLQPMHE